ncbi:MAG: glycosyltransferase family 4 protein [Candidatus Zipacnadales bacterium]
MRVVLTAHHFIDYSIHLANGLADVTEVILAIATNKAERIQGSCLLQEIDPRVQVLPFGVPPVLSFSAWGATRRLIVDILTRQPDVVHMQEVNPWFDLLAPTIAARTALVNTVHDIERHPGHQEARRIQVIRNRAQRAAHRIIVHGRALKAMMVERRGTPPEKIHIIPHGNFLLHRKWGDPTLTDDGKTVLFFGRIWPYKGLEYLIKAEPLISQEIAGARIVIAGQGEDFRRYRALMHNPDHFEVHNRFLNWDESADLFRRASVVALPYTEASQSGVLAKAYTFGKPVVVTNVGSLPEVVDEGKTGLVIPPCNVAALARAIVSILGDASLRKKMSHAAYEKATTDLSWSRIARLTVHAYQEALEVAGSMRRR